MLSYGERIALFQKDFEKAFLEVFDLSSDYSRKELIPGDRTGFIDWYSQETDFDKGMGQYESLIGQFVLTFGAENKQDCDRICAIERNNIPNNIAKIREKIDGYGIVYHLELKDSRSSAKSQLLVNPNYWLCDIASTISALMVIPKDITGKEMYFDANTGKPCIP